jgi:hypothetical protein
MRRTKAIICIHSGLCTFSSSGSTSTQLSTVGIAQLVPVLSAECSSLAPRKPANMSGPKLGV